MRIRWSIILPVIGLLLFLAVTIRSAGLNEHDKSHPHRYFWWSSLRLDSDPLNQHPIAPVQPPCPDGKANCAGWELRERWVTPALVDRALVLSALPAFLAGSAIVAGLSKLGVDEVLTFMVSMPILIFAWYFFVGWLLERWRVRRQQRKSSPLKIV